MKALFGATWQAPKTIRREEAMKALFGNEKHKFSATESFSARKVTLNGGWEDLSSPHYAKGEFTFRLLPANTRTFHRLLVACPNCSAFVPFGRITQHVCKFVKPTWQKLRTCRFAPYRSGPKFSLVTWETGLRDKDHRIQVAYQFKQDRRVIFQGQDFWLSQYSCIDGNEAMASLMGFLTLREGDTDQDYFVTQDQIDFSNEHAETLSAYCFHKFEKGGY